MRGENKSKLSRSAGVLRPQAKSRAKSRDPLHPENVGRAMPHQGIRTDLRTLVKGVKWIVFDDSDGSLPSKEIKNATVRSVSFKSYRPVRGESIVIIGGIEVSAAMEEALHLLGEDGLQLVEHPLFTTPMFLQGVAALYGRPLYP